MMVMVVCFSILETTAKYLSRFYPVPMLVWCRYTVTLLLMLLLFAPKFGAALVRTTQPAGQVLRAALLMGSTSCYFGALSFLPMAEVKAVSFISPLLVTVLAVWWLHEQVSRAALAGGGGRVPRRAVHRPAGQCHDPVAGVAGGGLRRFATASTRS